MVNESLGRNAAANRARLAIAEAMGLLHEGQATISGAEVLRSFQCKDKIHALAKLPTSDPVTLPACAGALPGPEREGGACPAWTERVGYREGDDLVGVGLVEGIKDRGLAEQTAQSRALANAQRTLKVRLKIDGSALEAIADTDGVAFGELRRELARCGSITAVKVSVKLSN